MSDSDGGTVIDAAECIAETEKAILVISDDTGKVWIPKSQVHDDSEVFDADRNSRGALVVKTWFAEKQGWG